MTDCQFCKKPGFDLRYDELRGRYVLYDRYSELPHTCRENPWDVMESVERFSKNFHEKWKFKIPIWCNICETHYRPDCVCSHIRLQGFVEGIDNVTYFSDKWEAIEERHRRMKKIKELQEKNDESVTMKYRENESMFSFT